ncbi:hypothetical protein HYC85_029090 [Camellia sinensis]|uniref:DUF4216 domain-containing protein n=1 Tax=Camellia sinensis TaxID=4442 RepID=A0A7J7FX88_CAMSI|nr:hypothetical protein HYC85_029090 [Camellia sinensis]
MENDLLNTYVDIGDDIIGMIQGAMGNPHADTSVEGDEPQGPDPHAFEPQLGPNAETAKWKSNGDGGSNGPNKGGKRITAKQMRKQSYLGHRRFLPTGHKFRKDKVSFDGTREVRLKPKLLSGTEMLLQLESEAAQFTMTKDEKDLFLKVLKEVRVPDSYSSNISRRVRSHDRSIGGLKSYDSHILMQQLIPLAIRRSLPKNVQTLRRTTDVIFSEEIILLANGPHNLARRFNGYILNGFRYRVKAMDDRRATQNCGVALKADTISYASRKDKNPRVGSVYYYGQLTDIVEIRYSNEKKHVLFKCDWIDNIHGKKEDVFNFTLVNFNHLLYRDDRITNEPFILASQAEQVWYVADPLQPDWQVVVKMSQRGLFDMSSTDPQIEPYMSQQLEENIMLRDEEVGWVREAAEGETVDIIMGRKRKPDHPRRMMSDVLHNRTSVAPPSEEASHRPLSEGPLVAPQQLPCTQPPHLPSVRPPSVPPQQLSSSAYEPSVDPSTSSQPTSGHVSSSSTSTRRGRGCAKGIKEWGTGKKLDIQFDGNYCPIGDNVAKLTTQLGIIVRNGNIVPLTFLDWNNVPADIIDAIWKDVKDNLNICPEEYKPICMKNCNSIWKDHKNKLKAKYFKPRSSDPNLKDDVPMHIVPSQ